MKIKTVFYDSLEEAKAAEHVSEHRLYWFKHGELMKYAWCKMNLYTNAIRIFALQFANVSAGLVERSNRNYFITKLMDENAALKTELAALKNGQKNP